MGWGEFEAGIRIFFKDPDEKVRPATASLAASHYCYFVLCGFSDLYE